MKIYFDMDGVLADFDRGVREICGADPGVQGKNDPEQEKRLWDAVRAADRFYARLEEIEGSRELFLDLLERYGPDLEILTGIPKPERNIPGAAADKTEWAARHLSPSVPVRAVLRREKKNYADGKDTYLIDDYESNVREWEAAGGTGILFRSAKETAEKLRALGLI